jgi:hypothetical protein
MKRLLVLLVVLAGCARRPGTATAGQPSASTPSTSPGRAAPEAASSGVSTSDPGERSSSAIHRELLACLAAREGAEGASGKSAPLHVKTWYCVCMTDALGLPVAALHEAEPSARRCLRFARATGKSAPDSKRTPFTGKSFWSAGQIAGAQQGCLRKAVRDPATRALDETQQDTFCSCLVDNMRARRVASPASLPVEVSRACAETAGFHW